MERNELTQESLKAILRYDSEAGHFWWMAPAQRRTLSKPAGTHLPTGYINILVNGRLHRAHRLAWLYVYGFMPEMIDHINGVRDDNRISNLRNCDSSVNAQNRRSAGKNSITGFLGVSQIDQYSYQARIRIPKGKQIALGTYRTAEEAHQAYLTAKRQLHEGCAI